jgi:glutathione peroxidase
MRSPLYDIGLRRIDGSETSLDEFAGKVLLVVNVASECGLTPQYEGLEELYATYRDRGFAVLGFPSNEFGGQEPGTEAEIASFCRSVYGVDFPMFAKTLVNGDERAPLYRQLIAAQPRRRLPAAPRAHVLRAKDSPDIRWNFEKFLVARKGEIVARFDPDIVPSDPAIVSAIEKELAAPAR